MLPGKMSPDTDESRCEMEDTERERERIMEDIRTSRDRGG